MKKIKHLLSSRKLFAAVLTIALLASLIPLGIVLGNNAGAINPDYVENGYGVNEDNNTVEPETIVPGQVWTDKVVTSVAASPFDGVFNVQLKAVGGEISTTTSQAADIVFVLDRSTSMRNEDYNLMVEAVNKSIETIMESNTANKVAVVCFGSTANTLLGLGRYTSTNDMYLTYGSSTLAVSGTVSVESGSGGAIGSSIKTSDTNYTNIQAGLISAYNILNAAADSNMPAIVLMSDGGASKYTTNFNTLDISNASSWSQSTDYNDDDQFAHTAAYYTIRTANNIKSLLGAGSIYTIGYNLGRNNKVATATLNPTPANITATAALLSDWQDTLSEQLGTSNYQYNNDYYTGSNTSGLTAAMLSAVGEIIDSSSPILGDLIFTDNIGAGFGFITETDNTIAFRFDGDTEDRYAVKNATENRYEYTDPVTNISVVFDAGVPMQVRYTIPAAALRLAAYDDNNNICNVDTFNTLDFKVRLSDSVTTDPTDTYYTNYNNYPNLGSNNGCNVKFTLNPSSPYYTYTPTYSPFTATGESAVYTNALESYDYVESYSITDNSISVTLNPTNPAYTFEDLDISSITVRYNGSDYQFNSSAVDSISAGAGTGDDRYFLVIVDRDSSANGGYRLDPNGSFSFEFYPNSDTNKVRNISGTVSHERTNDTNKSSPFTPNITTVNASYTPESFSLTVVTVTRNSIPYTFTVADGDVTFGAPVYYYGTHYILITVDGEITQTDDYKAEADFEFYYRLTGGSGNRINDRDGTFTLYDYVETTPDPEFSFAPTTVNSGTTVTVSILDGSGTTFSGNATLTGTGWSFETTPTESGDTLTKYLVELSGNVLTVTTLISTTTTGTWSSVTPNSDTISNDGEVSRFLTETGWMKLAHADGSLRVEKQVTGYVGLQEFSFTVELEDEATTATLYKYVTDSNYTTFDLTALGNNYSFSLADNDYVIFTGLKHASDYKVTETNDNAFDTTISSSNTTVTANANGVFQGAIIGGPTTNKVTFTNAYKVGALTIGKTVFQDAKIVEEPEFALAAVSTPGYTFQVDLTLPSGITYQDISYDGDVVTKAPDSLTFTFSLGNGDYVTLGNIPEGTQYTVTEISSDDAVVYYSVNSTSYTEGKVATGNVTSNEDSVQFVNNYLTPAPLTILKNVTETDIYPLAPGSFDFEIFFYNLVEDEELIADAAVKAQAAEEAETYLNNTALPALNSAITTHETALGAVTAAQGALDALNPEDTGYSDAEQALTDAQTALSQAEIDLATAQSNYELAEGAWEAAKALAEEAASLAEPKEVGYSLLPDEIIPELTAIDGDGNEGRYTFTLAASGSISFTNLPIGLYYRVTETTTGAKTTITNSQKTDDNLDLTTEGQIVWNYEDVDDNENNAITVVYTNDFSISFGSLSLTKDFDDSTAFWKLPQDGNFTFDITIGETIYEDVALNSENGYSKTYSDLIPGTTYSIEETTPGTYTTNAPFSGTIQASGQWGTEEVTLECVNTYEPPVNVTKTVNNDSVTTGTTVTYTGTVTYENPYDVTSIVLTDLRFSAIPDSFTLTSLGSAELDPNWDGEEGEDALVWNSTHDQLEIHLQPQQMEEPSASDTNTITFTYQVRFNSAGEYDNTVTADVIYYREISFNDSASASVTVTDPYTPPPYNPPPVIITSDPEYGTLTVVKNVTGENAPTDVSFNITVQFSGTLNTILYNGTNNADGLYTLSLAAGQSGTFTNIPLNTTFAVTEALTVDQSDGGWMAPAEDIEGIINSTTPVTVSVNNVYDAGLQGDVDVDEELEPETETGVAGDAEKDDILPQTGGISSSTLLGIFGLALIAIGGAVFMAMRRKFVGKSKSK